MKRLFILVLNLICLGAFAQRTIGLLQYDVPNTDGYVLFAPMPGLNTYLVDKCGKQVHQWSSTYRPGSSVYLLEDGSLLRPGITNNAIFTSGGSGGIIEKYSWNGALTWSYLISDSNQCQHHDVRALPNGNVLAIVWDRHTKADATLNGKNPATGSAYIWSEKIVELQPVGANSANIVWEWRLWDHMVQEFDSTKANYDSVIQHPELININYTTGGPNNQDWIHMNSIDYNAALDQIVVSSHNLNGLWIIDHSTTTAQAATHAGGNSGMGGDLMYRWGNPRAYNRGTNADQKFFGQHHATWIPQGFPNEGKILVFNNGLNRPGGNASSVDMIETPIDANHLYPVGTSAAFLPTNLYWTYKAPNPADFYASNISGAYPLPNGSFMICTGTNGIFFEIDSSSTTVWKYISPVNNAGIMTQGTTPTGNLVFRCVFYPPSYPGFTGVTLTPGNEIELNPTSPSLCILASAGEIMDEEKVHIYPNPSHGFITVSGTALQGTELSISVFDMLGKEVVVLADKEQLSGAYEKQFNFSNNLKAGMYIVKISSGHRIVMAKLNIE